MEVQRIEAEQKKIIDKLCNDYTSTNFNLNDTQNMDNFISIFEDLFNLQVDKIWAEENVKSEEIPPNLREIEIEIEENPPVQNPESLASFHTDRDKCYITLYNKNFFEQINKDNQRDRTYGILNMVNNILHEMEHYRQRIIITQEPVNKEKLEYGKDLILKDLYRENYFFNSLETGAYSNSSAEMSRIMGDDQYVEDFKDNVEEFAELIRLTGLTARYKYGAMLQPKDVVRQSKLDKIIAGNDSRYNYSIERIGQEIVDSKDKALSAEYNIAEKRRWTPSELIVMESETISEIKNDSNYTDSEKEEKIQETKELYYDILSRELEVASQAEIEEFKQVLRGRKHRQTICINVKLF